MNDDDENFSSVCYKPKAMLRDEPLKRALRSYLVNPVLKKYVVCSIRCLWKDNDSGFNDMLQKRKTVENCLLQVEEIALVASCVTAMKENVNVKCGLLSGWALILQNH